MLHQDSHVSDPELLSAADGELTAGRLREVRAHLQACWTCRTRMAELELTIAHFVSTYRSVLDRQLPAEDITAARLRERVAQQTSGPVNRFLLFPREGLGHWRWRWAFVAPLFLAIVFWAGTYHGKRQTALNFETQIVPNSRLTPGEATSTSREEVCGLNTQMEQQGIPEALKRAVFTEYGVKDAPQAAYEVDFLITPELGGSTSIRNLWPQPYFSRKWNAHVKDALEERLHKLVCSGSLDLSTAQREVATNWVDAYKKYVQTDDAR